MQWQFVPSAFPLLAASASLLVIAFFAWRRRGTPGAAALAFLMVAGVVWGLAYALSLSSATPPAKYFWDDIKYLGIVAVPSAWLAFALGYTGRGCWLTPRKLLLLAIEPLATLLLIFTNEAHGLFWISRNLTTIEPVSWGPWFWIHTAYSYLLVLVGTVFLIRALVSSATLYRGQRVALLVGALVLWLGNAANISGLIPAGYPDPAPFAFVVTGVAFLWALLRYGLLDIVPVARSAVIDGMRDGMIVLDTRDRIVELNPAAQLLLGRPASKAVGRHVSQVMPGWVAMLERHRDAEEGHEEATVLGDEPAPRTHEFTFSALRDRSGQSTGRLILVRDITERKRAEEELRHSEYELAEAQRIGHIGSWSFEVAQGELRWSDEMYRIFGFAPQEFAVTYKRFLQLVHPDDKELLQKAVREALSGDEDRYSLDYRLVRPDGETRFLHSQYEAVRDGSGRTVRLVGTSMDVTEHKTLEERLEHQAFHDALTDLPNRMLFMDRLGHALSRAKRRAHKKIAVLFADLDNFKFVNDTLGHHVGDELLVAVSDRLRKCLRPEDSAARLGGDEFAVLLEDVEGVSEAALVAQRIIEELRTPFVLSGQEVFVTPSIGIALGEASQDMSKDLVRNADVAMYRAKEEGKARYQVFDSGMQDRITDRLKLENDLRRALERNEFRVYYQPVVALDTGRIVDMEALVRWEHPEQGLVPPSEFVPLAEEIGLIVAIGRLVLREACRQTRAWQERYPSAPPLLVGVNLSARQLRHSELIEDVEGALRERAGAEVADPGDHGGFGGRGGRTAHRRPPRHQGAGGALRLGRFRDRILLPVLPQAPAGGDAEDRPLVRGEDRGGRRGRGPGRGHCRGGKGPGPAGGGRGRGDLRAAGAGKGAGVRSGPGILLLCSAADEDGGRAAGGPRAVARSRSEQPRVE